MTDPPEAAVADTALTKSNPKAVRQALGLRWWKEVVYILAFYLVYSYIRNKFGSATVGTEHAFHNAEAIIALERSLGLYHEEGIQDLFIGNEPFMHFWNVFYGTFHFAVTAFAMIFTYHRFPERYQFWRNVLACTTGLALIGFSLFPLMPPRLLDDPGLYGGLILHPGSTYGFNDSLATIGGLWSFDSGTMSKVSNQFAAMPSLHFAWSAWCFLVLYKYLKPLWAKVAIGAYPWLTLFGIMVTANHYWIDAAGGVLILAVGYVLGIGLTRFNARRQQRRLAS